MQQYLSKALPIAAALVMFSNLSFADMTEVNLLAQSKEQTKEQTKKQKMQQTKNEQQSRLEDRWNIFVFGDAILAQADQDNMSLGVVNNAAPAAAGSTNIASSQASTVNMHWKYAWSFRVGIGGTMEHDHWKPILSWTHLRSTASTTQNTTDTQSLIPGTWITRTSVASAVEDVDSVKGKWHVATELLDLVVGREYCASKWLQMTPYGGLRSGFIFQEFNTAYSGGLLLPNSVNNNTMKSRFWGIGPELGLILDFGLGGGFSVDVGSAFSIVHGFFNTSRFEQVTSSTTGLTTTAAQLSNKFRATRAMTDLCIGIKYKRSFARDRYEVGGRLGYEQHMFFDQNAFITTADGAVPGVHAGDLGFQGFSFGAMVGF